MDDKTLAIGGAVVVAGGLVLLATKSAPSRPPLTNSGAPVDAPGQVLPGEPDYVKVYLGQKLDALTRFGIGEFGTPTTPITPRSHALTAATYWTAEINRLCGLDRRTPFAQAVAWDDSEDTQPPLALAYHGMVTLESATTIIHGWNQIRPRLQRAMLDGLGIGTLGQLSKPLTLDGARAFWFEVTRLAILVDVDRAVPDHSGFAWIAIREAAVELPGRIGEAAARIGQEAAGLALAGVAGLLKGFVFSPIGAVMVLGASWIYRAELSALWGRIRP